MKDRRANADERHPGEDPLEGSWSLAYVDDLTGLYNRRLLTYLFEERWADLVACHPEFSLILIDLDRFKEVNDRYGHLAGDSVLKTVADLLREHFREKDLVIRYGGDEFVVLLPGAGRVVASTLAERARDAMNRKPFLAREGGRALDTAVSFSLGVATHHDGGSSGEAILAAADRQLYSEKRRRRSPRWRVRLLASGAAMVVVIAGALFARQQLDGVAPAPLDRTGLFDADRQQLRLQIRDLEGQLDALTDALNRAGTDRDEAAAAAYEGTIRDLQNRIQRLQANEEPPAERSAEGPAPAQTPEPQISTGQAPESQISTPQTPEPQTSSPQTPEPQTSTARTPEPQISAAQTESIIDRSARQAAPNPENAAREPPRPVVTRPVLMRRGRASYPRMALQVGRAALLRFRVQVDVNGRATSAELLGLDPGLGFAGSGRDVVLGARYKPGTRDGVPVAGETIVIVRFELPR